MAGRPLDYASTRVTVTDFSIRPLLRALAIRCLTLQAICKLSVPLDCIYTPGPMIHKGVLYYGYNVCRLRSFLSFKKDLSNLALMFVIVAGRAN